MYTTLSLHDITKVTIDERVHNTYVTRKLTMTDKNGDQAFVTLFADDRNALTFNYNPMQDTRENAT
jgi:hypothetical protein